MPYYAHTTIWQQNEKLSFNLGYTKAANEQEAKGIAVEIGQKNCPGYAMAGCLVLLITDFNLCVDSLEEVAKLVGLDLATTDLSLNDIMAEVRKRLGP
jgi:hypothetical protein